ncbi:MAG: hypothetical protein AB1416_05160, partial [Actinomycetota bacterium]
MSVPPILRTRMLAPRLPDDSLPREDLVRRVVDGLSRRLVTVVASAGYGKSTLLAQAVEQCPHPWVWLGCDDRMHDAGVLLAHVAAGIEERVPGFGARLALAGPPRAQVAELCNEVLATVPEDIVVVIDDAHLLLGASGAEALALMVADLPPNVHLAVASRAMLPVPLSRLRASGRVLQVGEADLALSERESADLVRAQGLDLPPAAVRDLHRRTEGWVTGVVLAAQAGGTLPDPGSDAAAHLFDYLAEEAFLSQPGVLRDFLLATAVLERFTPEVAAAVTGSDDARAVIEEIEARHLFIVRAAGEDGDTFRYHHLFARFLRRRLADGGADVADLERRAGDAWRQAGAPLEAVPHYLAAGAPEAAVDALEPVAEAVVHSPDAERLRRWLDEIPPALWADRPALLLAHGTLLFARGDYGHAIDALESAVDRLTAIGEHGRAASAFFALGRALVTAGGRQRRGMAAARRFLPRIDASAPMLPAARIATARLYGYACRYDRVEDELAAAMALPAARGWAVLPAYVLSIRAFLVQHPRGRGDQALGTLGEAIGELERREAEDVLAMLPYAHAYRAIVLADVGRAEDALRELERLEAVSARRGLLQVAAPVIAWIRFSTLATLGRWGELAEEVERSAALFAGLGGQVRGYHYPAACARLAAHRRDPDAVTRNALAARASLREHGYAFEEAMVEADLALAARAAGLGSLARDTAEAAAAAARR